MCDFPSWIEEPNGNVVFLTDKDLGHFPPEQQYDAVGHHGLRRVYPGLKGVEKEGFPPPPEIRRAINRGQMRKLAKLGGYRSVRCTESLCEAVEVDGGWRQVHCKNGECILRTGVRSDGFSFLIRYKNGFVHGRSEYVFSDGGWCIARWKHGLLHGLREYVKEDGSWKQARYENGRVVSRRTSEDQ